MEKPKSEPKEKRNLQRAVHRRHDSRFPTPTLTRTAPLRQDLGNKPLTRASESSR
ncbi:unnamed protein product [Arabidopsis halleri]